MQIAAIWGPLIAKRCKATARVTLERITWPNHRQTTINRGGPHRERVPPASQQFLVPPTPSAQRQKNMASPSPCSNLRAQLRLTRSTLSCLVKGVRLGAAITTREKRLLVARLRLAQPSTGQSPPTLKSPSAAKRKCSARRSISTSPCPARLSSSDPAHWPRHHAPYRKGIHVRAHTPNQPSLWPITSVATLV